MAEKAKNLTDIYNIFKLGALTDEQKNFYQPTAPARSGLPREMHDTLYDHIKKAKNNFHSLVVGHGGCGKSTELHMLASKLKAEGGSAIFIQAREDFSLNSFSYIDIFVRIVEKALLYAKENDIDVNKHLLKAFHLSLWTKTTEEYWNTMSESGVESEISANASLPFVLKILAKLTASFRMGSGMKEELRIELKPKMEEISESFNALIDDLNSGKENYQRMMVVIDGLEKCRSENVREMFRDDIEMIATINTHIFIACPISIFRSADAAMLQGYFGKPEIMPMIKTHEIDSVENKYEEGIEIIKELILRRADGSFFEEGVLEKIVMMGGGNLRDTFFIIENSAFLASQYGKETVDMNSADRIMTDFALDIFLRVRTRQFGPAMKAIYEGEHRVLNEEQLFELLYAGIVFEYNGERWVDLHPLVRMHLNKHPGVLK